MRLKWIMLQKLDSKTKAVELRRIGFSYSEILKHVYVSQSSLSLWLKDIKLTDEQKLRLDEKGNKARKLGSMDLKADRIRRTKNIISIAKSEIKAIENKDLMLIGIVLYWAEGSKQKEHDVSKEVTFSNSDPRMIQVYIKWLTECLDISTNRIAFEIYIHESHKKTISELKSYWSGVTGFPKSRFGRVYFKKNKIHTMRRNRGLDYSGVLRICVKKSTDLNRKIAGWIEGICEKVGAGL
jgi:hypothetical protein